MPSNERQRKKRNEKLAELAYKKFLEALDEYDMSYSDLCDITISAMGGIVRAHSCKECCDCYNSLDNNFAKIEQEFDYEQEE